MAGVKLQSQTKTYLPKSLQMLEKNTTYSIVLCQGFGHNHQGLGFVAYQQLFTWAQPKAH